MLLSHDIGELLRAQAIGERATWRRGFGAETRFLGGEKVGHSAKIGAADDFCIPSFDRTQLVRAREGASCPAKETDGGL